MNQIQKAAGELTTNPATALKLLTTALTGLKGKIQPMIAELNKACPKSATFTPSRTRAARVRVISSG